MLRLFFLFLLVFSIFNLSAQNKKRKTLVKDTLESEAFIKMVEFATNAFYADFANKPNLDSIITALDYDDKQIIELSDDEICKKLNKLNEISTFKYDCNSSTISVIRFFNSRRRSFIKIALGRSKLYFDLYEEYLDKYDLPHELKYLSVIESGLRPQVKSPAGALGLWQFMYGTGKMYGLKENSYFDERMDPNKATDAACRYLKKLYDIYGDWNLALASYNAGPGNVNKAIRRSGGKTTYWEVRPFLPRETQGYVPNFIAASFLMHYFKEMNLFPIQAKTHYYLTDTMCLKTGVHMETIGKIVDWDIADIKELNPVYKRTYIPQTFPNQCIQGPLLKIGKLVTFEDSLYKLETFYYGSNGVGIKTEVVKESSEVEAENTTSSDVKYHKVRKGETLSTISRKYGVSNKEIMEWNNLRSSKVPYGKVLKIENKATLPDSIMGTVYYDSLVTVYHTVERNENIEKIASKYNVKVDDIVAWNNLNDKWLKIGQRLLIVTNIKIAKPGMVPNPNKTDEITEKPALKINEKPTPTVSKKYYTVRSGDLFNRIAQKHGLSTQELKRLNPGVNPDRINVGQKLRVK